MVLVQGIPVLPTSHGAGAGHSSVLHSSMLGQDLGTDNGDPSVEGPWLLKDLLSLSRGPKFHIPTVRL